MCLDDEDEKFCQKRETTLAVITLLIFLMLIGGVLGEICYRLEFYIVSPTHEGDEDNDDSLLTRFIEDGDLSDFNKIHSEHKIGKLVASLDLKFKSYELVQKYQDIYNMEVLIHNDNVIDAEICLKYSLGTNELAGKFLDYVEFGFFTKNKMKIAKYVRKIMSKFNFRISSLILDVIIFTWNITLYYLDLIKDILFIIFIRNITKGTSYNINEEIIVNTLITIICINEAYKVIISLSMKKGLHISIKGMVLLIIAFPFLPAILFYVIARSSHERNSTKDLNLVQAINMKIWEIKKFIARMKRSENALENLLQLIIIILLIGVTLSPTTPLIKIKLLSFIDARNVILYFAAIVSILTIIRASLSQLQASFNGYLPIKGALLYGMFLLLSVASRILASLLYFSPIWGLMPILWHWRIGKLDYHVEIRQLEYSDSGLRINDVWSKAKDYEYVWIEHSFFPLIFFSLYLLQIFITFIVRCKYEGKSEALGNALDSVISPSNGGIISILTFTLGNMVLIIPMWVLQHILNK